MFVECVIVALYFCLKVQEPLRIIIDPDSDGEGRTSRAILNVEPGMHCCYQRSTKSSFAAQRNCKWDEENHPLLCIYSAADLTKEAGSEWGLQLVWGARKRRTRSETLSIDAAALLLGEGERRRQEPGPEAQKDEAIHAVEAAPAKRSCRCNPKYDTTQWITWGGLSSHVGAAHTDGKRLFDFGKIEAHSITWPMIPTTQTHAHHRSPER